MGFLIAAAATVGSVIGAVFIGLLKDEASAWLPRATSYVLRIATGYLPRKDRERQYEEWSAHILEYPGKLTQFFQALRFLRAGMQMSDPDASAIDRKMSIMVAATGFASMADLWYQKYHTYSPILEYVLGFANFVFAVTSIWFMCWLIWAKPQILKRLKKPDE